MTARDVAAELSPTLTFAAMAYALFFIAGVL